MNYKIDDLKIVIYIQTEFEIVKKKKQLSKLAAFSVTSANVVTTITRHKYYITSMQLTSTIIKDNQLKPDF